MKNDLAVIDGSAAMDRGQHSVSPWTPERVDLLRRTFCKGASDDELEMFLAYCQRTGLDPFAKQVHAVMRWDGRAKREVMTIQVGIDGLRLIADRTGRYVPGRATEFEYDAQGHLTAAIAYVKKLVAGEWHETAAKVYWEEYAQYDKESKPLGLWGRMPRVMLGKVAESVALRRAFPADLSGVYAPEEMGQAENEPYARYPTAGVEVRPIRRALPAPEVVDHPGVGKVNSTTGEVVSTPAQSAQKPTGEADDTKQMKVYVLREPVGGEARYIGQTTLTLEKRFDHHFDRARAHPDRDLSRWLLHLKSLGLKPDMEVLEETMDASAEGRWIQRYLESGANLLNATRDGKGTGNGLGRGNTKPRHPIADIREQSAQQTASEAQGEPSALPAVAEPAKPGEDVSVKRTRCEEKFRAQLAIMDESALGIDDLELDMHTPFGFWMGGIADSTPLWAEVPLDELTVTEMVGYGRQLATAIHAAQKRPLDG